MKGERLERVWINAKKERPLRSAPCSGFRFVVFAMLVVYGVATCRALYPDALSFCKRPGFSCSTKHPAQFDVVRVSPLNLENPTFVATEKDGSHLEEVKA